MSRISNRLKSLEKRQPQPFHQVLYAIDRRDGEAVLFQGKRYESTKDIERPADSILIVFKPTPPEAKP